MSEMSVHTSPEVWMEAVRALRPMTGGPPWPAGWFNWPGAQEAHRRLAKEAAAALPNAPPHDWEGDGIVIAGGGRYWAGTYVLVRLLRHLGCRLPIEIWYYGHGKEMEPARRALVEPYGVRCIDADAVQHVYPRRTWGGWQIKPFAVYHSPFRRVLYLDADCYPAADPTPLLSSADFNAKGAWFFPDCAAERLTPRTWDIFGLPYKDEPAFESGQFFVDKAAVFRELLLTLHYNDYSDFYYQWRDNTDPFRIIYGDKDTFHFAWWALNRPYLMYQRAPDVDGRSESYLHRDGAGKLLFMHRCRNKFRLPGETFATRQTASAPVLRAHLPNEAAAWRFFEELTAASSAPNYGAAAVIQRAERPARPVSLCVPTLNRYDLLERLIRAARAGTVPPDRIVVMDNGGKCPDMPGVEIMRPGWNIGVAASWNWFLRNVPDAAVIANDDVEPAPDAIEALCRAADADPRGLVFVSGEAGPFQWSFFLQRRESLSVVGPYDEEFWPAYYEDDDYRVRLQRAGRPAVEAAGVRFRHDASASAAGLTEAERLTHERHYAWGKAHYMQKWGGPPKGGERFAVPFNDTAGAWRPIPGAFSFADVYRRAVAEARPGGLLVEVGVWKGRSLAFLAAAAAGASKGLRVFGVDHFCGDRDARTRFLAAEGGGCYVGQTANYLAIAGALPHVRLLICDSVAAAELFPDGGVDFVMLDAAHDSAGLRADLNAWWPKVRAGGLLAGHDYTNPQWPDVRPTADAFFAAAPGGLDSGLGDGCFLVRSAGVVVRAGT